MKLSVSLTDADLALLDRFVEEAGLESRSAGIQRAIRSLRDARLEAAYAGAWDEWIEGGAAEDWEPATGDALDATR